MTASTLLPKDAVLALRPSGIAHYLTTRGWSSEPYGTVGQGRQFRSASLPGVDLLLPMDPALGDYEQRMVDLVVALATIEKRPIWETLDDLSRPLDDILGVTARFSGKILSVTRGLRPLLPDVAGWMVMATDVNGTSARVKADLVSGDFALACEALRDDLAVEVSGVIRHDVMAREYVLTEPSELHVLSHSCPANGFGI
jgi:hypothetical protein